MLTWLFAVLALGGSAASFLATAGRGRGRAAVPGLVFLVGFLLPLPLDLLGVGRGTTLVATLVVQGLGGLLGLCAAWTSRLGRPSATGSVGAFEESSAAPPIRSRLFTTGLAVLTGVLFVAGIPLSSGAVVETGLVGWWPLAWVALIPLLWAIEGRSPKAALGLGLLAGFVASLLVMNWLPGTLEIFMQVPPPVAWLLVLLLTLYRGLMLGLFAMALAWLGRTGHRPHPVAVAAIFTVIEHLFPVLFPVPLGATQYPVLPVVQIADLVGVAGITFVVVAVNAALFEFSTRLRGGPTRGSQPFRSRVSGLVVPCLCVVVLAYGFLRLSMVEGAMTEARVARVGIIQPNIDVFSKEAKHLSGTEAATLLRTNLLKLQHLSAELDAEDLDLLLWPETVFSPLGGVYAKRTPHFGTGLTRDGRLAVWTRDGGTFRWELAPHSADSPGGLRALGSSGERAACMVGASGKASCWNGEVVSPVEVPGSGSLNAVSLVGSDDPKVDIHAWAVGDGGVLLRGDSKRWHSLNSRTDKDLNSVWMVQPSFGHAVGDDGTIIAIIDGKIMPPGSIGKENLTVMWTTPDYEGFYIGGEGGALFYLADDQWNRAALSTTATIRAFAGRSNRDVWAVGDGGTVLWRGKDGRSWEAVAPPAADVDLVSAFIDARGMLIVASKNGRVWSADPWDIRAGGKPLTWKSVAVPDALGGIVALARSPLTVSSKTPRDGVFMAQSRAPLPAAPDASLEPDLETVERNVIQRGFRTPVVTGAITRPATKDGWNSAVAVDETGRIVGVADKARLLPVAETMPTDLLYGLGGEGFRDVSADLYHLASEATRFDHPERPGVLTIAGLRLGIMICYEDILTATTLDLADQSPDLLVNLTNDAWFGVTSQPYAHLALSTLRSVELRRTLLRSTQTGISAMVLPTGEIAAKTALGEARALAVDAPVLDGGTVYGTVGDSLVYVAVAALGLWMIRRRRPMVPPTDGAR